MSRKIKDYLIFKSLQFPAILLSFLPYVAIHAFARFLGALLYHCIPKFRKRALSNLSHATDLNFSKQEKVRIAKRSLASQLITCFEYAKMKRDRRLKNRLTCENPEYAQSLIDQKQGVIFFCAHQANWEALFLEGTMRMPGVAVGNTFKNPYLTDWINSIRERFGGKIIAPDEAIKEGMRALKQGKFLGLVGDQALPSSDFSSIFLGTKAWTSPLPAILSYKLQCPIIFASIRRENCRYKIHYSDPLWPNKDHAMKDEVSRLMNQLLSLLEESIKQRPGEWMWQHNRWKQETPENVYYRFRQDTLSIMLPKDQKLYAAYVKLLPLFEQIYPQAFMTLFIPKGMPHPSFRGRIHVYQNSSDILIDDLLTKLVFNFTGIDDVKKHYMKQTAFDVLSFEDLKVIAYQNQGVESDDLREIIIKAVCRPEFFQGTNALCPI